MAKSQACEDLGLFCYDEMSVCGGSVSEDNSL